MTEQDEMWDEQGRPRFNGADYDPALDDQRLGKQIGRVYEVMKDGRWRPLHVIAACIRQRFDKHDPEASISAQLRHLRKPRFGSHKIERRRAEQNEALWEYRMV